MTRPLERRSAAAASLPVRNAVTRAALEGGHKELRGGSVCGAACASALLRALSAAMAASRFASKSSSITSNGAPLAAA